MLQVRRKKPESLAGAFFLSIEENNYSLTRFMSEKSYCTKQHRTAKAVSQKNIEYQGHFYGHKFRPA